MIYHQTVCMTLSILDLYPEYKYNLFLFNSTSSPPFYNQFFIYHYNLLEIHLQKIIYYSKWPKQTSESFYKSPRTEEKVK